MSLPPASVLLLGLAWFAAVNAVASALSWGMGSFLASAPHVRRQGLLLAVRLLPSVSSVLFVLTMFVPAHLRFEPRGMGESFGLMLYALAIVGVGLLWRSAGRAAAVARAGRRLRACAHLSRIDGDIYEVRGLSGVSLAGVWRPRVLVGTAVRRRLTRAELDVAVAHELAHRHAYDNVKRFLMFCAPDMFGASRTAKRLEEQWRASAEWLADARAVDGDPRRAIDLASALGKVARLGAGSSGSPLSPAWSTLHDPPLLEQRVRRLVGPDVPTASRPLSRGPIALAGLAGALLALGAATAGRVHQLTESLVHLLS